MGGVRIFIICVNFESNDTVQRANVVPDDPMMTTGVSHPMIRLCKGLLEIMSIACVGCAVDHLLSIPLFATDYKCFVDHM